MGTRQIWICLDSSVYTRGASWLALIGYINPGSNRGACTRVWYDKATKSAQVTLPPVYPPTRPRYLPTLLIYIKLQYLGQVHGNHKLQ